MKREEIDKFWMRDYYAKYDYSINDDNVKDVEHVCFSKLFYNLPEDERCDVAVTLYLRTPEKINKINYNHICLFDKDEIDVIIKGINYYIPFEYQINEWQKGYSINFKMHKISKLQVKIMFTYLRMLFEHPFCYFAIDALELMKQKRLHVRNFLHCFLLVQNSGNFNTGHALSQRNNLNITINKKIFNKCLRRLEYPSVTDFFWLMSIDYISNYIEFNTKYTDFIDKDNQKKRLRIYRQTYRQALLEKGKRK